MRTHDTVGRLEGDKFVVLVESAARGMRLDSLARRVMEVLHRPIELDGFGPSFSLTVSIGVAFGRYATPDELLGDAEQAMRSAEAAGRDRYTLYNANMRSVIEGRGAMEIELNAALQDKQLFLLYQPIFDLATRRVVGLEALVRWQHPTRGVLGADEFLPLAEETGLIVPIGRWALEEACSRAAAWNVAGRQGGVSIKATANQLNRDGFLTDVRRALQQSGIAPSLLTLDISEASAMRDISATAAQLEQIKLLGVRIALDDLDGEYAHHSELHRLALDFLKVDRRSLAASADEDYRNWLLEGIVLIGHDHSLPVIATGVDSYEQLASLQALGCAMAQGLFMGKPSPADDAERLFDLAFPAAPAALEPGRPLDAAQRRRRREAGRAHGRIQPGERPEGQCDRDPARHGKHRHDHDPPLARGVTGRGSCAERDPSDPAEQRQQDRLAEELDADVHRARSERAPQADLRAALEHGDDHHVRDPHAAHQQRDGAQAQEHGGERALGVGARLQRGGGAADGRVFGVLRVGGRGQQRVRFAHAFGSART